MGFFRDNTSKQFANCSPYFTALQYINNLETQRSCKTVNLKNINLKKKQLSSALNIIRSVGKVDKTVNKTANILIKSSILATG